MTATNMCSNFGGFRCLLVHDQIEDGAHIAGDVLCCWQHFIESLGALYPKGCIDCQLEMVLGI